MSKFYSYKTLDSDAIQVDWWLYGRPIPANGTINVWKKNDNIPVNVFLYFDNKAILDCVAKGTTLYFYFTWHSIKSMEGTSLHGISERKKYVPDNVDSTQDMEVPFTLDGKKIAGSIELSFSIAVEDCPNKDELNVYATEKGSIIYETSKTVLLEGTQALFPVKAIDFSSIDGIASNSLYFLKKKYSQMESNFNSSYTLYFNVKHPLFTKINSQNEDLPEIKYILKMIMYDVYKSITSDALDLDTGLMELEHSDKELFTLRAVYSRIVKELMDRRFPGYDLAGLKKLFNEDNDSKNKIYSAVQEFIFE